MQDIEFGEVVLVTHRKPLGLPKGITYKHTEKITNIDKFNYLMAYELGSYVNTDYIILVHYDGFIVHPEMWRNEFFWNMIISDHPGHSRQRSIPHIMMRMEMCAV